MVFVTPTNYPTNEDGFIPPKHGGTVSCAVGLVEYTDSTAKTLFTLPAGAVPIFWWIDIPTDFNAATTNTLEIGLSSDSDYFAAAIDVGTQGVILAGATNTVAARLGVRLSEETSITATFSETGTAATTGQAYVFVQYVLMGDSYAVD